MAWPQRDFPLVVLSLVGPGIQRLARKGFWGNRTAMSCGGLFRSSWWERSHSAFSFVLHFFTILTFPSEQCAEWFLVFWLFELPAGFEKKTSLIIQLSCSYFQCQKVWISWRKEIGWEGRNVDPLKSSMNFQKTLSSIVAAHFVTYMNLAPRCKLAFFFA